MGLAAYGLLSMGIKAQAAVRNRTLSSEMLRQSQNFSKKDSLATLRRALGARIWRIGWLVLR
jgi:hypothetical protein